MKKKQHVFVPKFNNRYQVTCLGQSIITVGTSSRGVLSEIVGSTQVRLISASGRTTVYDTQDGPIEITRLGHGERIEVANGQA